MRLIPASSGKYHKQNLSHRTIKITWVKCITYFILSQYYQGCHIVELYCELFSSFLFSWTTFIYFLCLHTHILHTFISLFHFITITWPLVEGGYLCWECKPIQGSIYDIHVQWKLYYFSFFITNTVPSKL